MGKRWEQHSDLCGCERCAIKADRGDESPTWDAVEDPDILDCGCDAWRGCDCCLYDPIEDSDYEDDE